MNQFDQSDSAAGTPPSDDNAIDPLIGRTLEGKYRLDAKLGAGGMGAVYRTTRLMIGDTVAVKILHAQRVSDPQAIERFRREAQAAARLKHQNAVAIYDFGVSNEGLVYLVMELAEGQSLRDMIKQQGHVTPSAAAEIMNQVCAALDEAHGQNIVHRDLKPDNIIVAASNTGLRAKVLDFGIAKMRDLTADNLTLTGAVMGTPYYMSPEHCMGEELDHRSDIYSLGIVLFEMLAGVVPFNSPISTAVVVQHVNQAPPSLRALNASISPAVEAVVMHALEKRREARPQTAVQLAQELMASVQGIPFTPHSVSAVYSPPASTTPSTNPVIGTRLAATIQMTRPPVISEAPTAAPAKRRLPLMLGVAVVIMMAAIALAVLMWSRREKTNSPKLLTIDLELVKSFNSKEFVHVLGFSPDGKLLAIGTGNGNEGEVNIYNVLTGEKIQSFNIGYVRSIAFSPDGKLIAVAADNAGTVIYDSNTGEQIKSLKGKTNVSSISFSKDGNYLGVAALYETYIFDVKTFGQLVYFKTKTYDSQISFDPNGNSFLIANSEGIFTYDLPTGNPLNSSTPNWKSVLSASHSPNGKFLAIGTLDSTILYDIANNKPTKLYEGFTNSVSFSPNGDFLVITTESKGAMIFNIQTGQKIKSIFNEGEGGTYAAQFSPKGNYLAINGNRKALLYGVQWKEVRDVPPAPAGMAYVPGNEFTMGNNAGDESERPPHKVTVKPFFIDLYEVTCEEYEKFIRATSRQPPATWANGHYPSGWERRPVTGINWDDASAFAEWAGKRLPTEQEWEFAARGSDGRLYPWGSEWKGSLANAGPTSLGHVVDVGTHPAGVSPFGAVDMVGNAWEWTASDFVAYPGGRIPGQATGTLKVIRGGCFLSRPDQATTAIRVGWPARGGNEYDNTGFRCAKDLPATSQPAEASGTKSDDLLNFSKNFAGLVGGKFKIEMKLQRNGGDLSGSYFFQSVRDIVLHGNYAREPERWADKNNAMARIDVPIRGTVDNQQNFIVEEFDDKGLKTGIFSGHFVSDAGMEGMWSKPNGKSQTQFSLKDEGDKASGGNYTIVSKVIRRKTGKFKIDISYPQLEGLSDENVQKDFNERVRALVTKDIGKSSNDEGEHGVGFSIDHRSGNLLSVVFGVYDEWKGAAHGQHYNFSYHYDLNHNKELKLSDFFLPGVNHLSILSKLCAREIAKQKRKNGMEYAYEDGEAAAFEALKEDATFYPAATALVFIFDPYQVGSYAEGYYVVSIPYSQLRGIINLNGPLAPFVN